MRIFVKTCTLQVYLIGDEAEKVTHVDCNKNAIDNQSIVSLVWMSHFDIPPPRYLILLFLMNDVREIFHYEMTTIMTNAVGSSHGALLLGRGQTFGLHRPTVLQHTW